MNGKRAFIFERPDELDTSNFFTIPKCDYRYINEPIYEDVNMNNRKIINCNKGTNGNDVSTIKNLIVYYKKGLTLNMSNQKITNLADGTDPNDAVNFKQLSSLDEKYIKREVNMVGELAVGYANMNLLPLLNVATSADLSSAVNLSQWNNHNTFNSHVNLNRNRINNLLPVRLPTDAITVGQVQRVIERKYGTLIFNRNNIAILHKCAIDSLIYPLCLYNQNTPEVLTVLLPPLIPTNNDGDTTNRVDFTDPIQLNDSPNNNPIPFTTGVYNQEPIPYKQPYILFVPPITPSHTSSRYANRRYCLF